MKRGALYFFYDEEGIVDAYNLYMLNDMRKNVDKLYVVVNGLINAEGKESFAGIADDVFVRENIGMDVWAYKEGMEHIGWDVVTSFDEFILMNYTNYGPVYPLQKMFDEMELREVDFWGITKHNGHDYDPYNACEYGYIPAHIQSSFIAVRKAFMKTRDYYDYWHNMPMTKTYVDSICKHEAVFTEKFTRLGYKSDVYVRTDDTKDVCDYPLMILPVEMIKKRKCPVFKRKSFYNVYEELMDISCGQSTVELLEYLEKETDYDMNMVWDNLLRTCNMWELKQRMQLNYILPRNYKKNLARQPKTALFMHVYHMDMLEEMREWARTMPDYADILISTNSQEKKESIAQAMHGLPQQVQIIVVENRGREYAGFLIGQRENLKKYEYICVAHSKRSRYEKPYMIGDSFTYHCKENTLASTEYVHNILATFEENPRLGLLVPPTPEHGMYYTTVGREWRGNYIGVKEKLAEWNMRAVLSPEKPPVAPLGGFFWFRYAALEKLFHIAFTYDMFPQEPCNENDGTIMHVIERIYPFVAQDAGYYSAWTMSDRYAAMRSTNEYKTIRDINECMFWVFGEDGRHGTLKKLYEIAGIAQLKADQLNVPVKQLVRTIVKRMAGPKLCAAYRKTANRIRRR